MENLELTHEEKKELEKRGFFVKSNKTFLMFCKNIFSIILLLAFFSGGFYLVFIKLNIDIKYNIYYFLVIGLIALIESLNSYIFSSAVFFNEKGVIGYGNSTNLKTIISQNKLVGKIYSIGILLGRPIFNIYNEIIDIPTNFLGKKSYGILIFPILVIMLPFFVMTIGVYNFIAFLKGQETFYVLFMNNPNAITIFFMDSVNMLCVIIIIFTTICGICFILNKLINKIFPLYLFCNIGEKIQKLTPKIEESSGYIQIELQSNLNFSDFNDVFNTLSSTFSDINSLVLRLGEIESRANKGNLFDSEKYINSLRSDIVTPLTSLKTFLENQKQELLESHIELTQVRVGGGESTGNTELQSKRSESLIQELTVNIEKLDVMIGNMGV